MLPSVMLKIFLKFFNNLARVIFFHALFPLIVICLSLIVRCLVSYLGIRLRQKSTRVQASGTNY